VTELKKFSFFERTWHVIGHRVFWGTPKTKVTYGTPQAFFLFRIRFWVFKGGALKFFKRKKEAKFGRFGFFGLISLNGASSLLGSFGSQRPRPSLPLLAPRFVFSHEQVSLLQRYFSVSPFFFFQTKLVFFAPLGGTVLHAGLVAGF
jgi:hypothetical protein